MTSWKGLQIDAGESAARLALTCAVKEVIGRGLYLIGLEAPEQM